MSKSKRNKKDDKKLIPVYKAFLEIAFILFLFYSNLLMGEFTRSGLGRVKGLSWAIDTVFTRDTFIVGMLLASIAYFVFDYFNTRFIERDH